MAWSVVSKDRYAAEDLHAVVLDMSEDEDSMEVMLMKGIRALNNAG